MPHRVPRRETGGRGAPGLVEYGVPAAPVTRFARPAMASIASSRPPTYAPQCRWCVDLKIAGRTLGVQQAASERPSRDRAASIFATGPESRTTFGSVDKAARAYRDAGLSNAPANLGNRVCAGTEMLIVSRHWIAAWCASSRRSNPCVQQRELTQACGGDDDDLRIGQLANRIGAPDGAWPQADHHREMLRDGVWRC